MREKIFTEAPIQLLASTFLEPVCDHVSTLPSSEFHKKAIQSGFLCEKDTAVIAAELYTVEIEYDDPRFSLKLFIPYNTHVSACYILMRHIFLVSSGVKFENGFELSSECENVVLSGAAELQEMSLSTIL